MMFFAVNRDCRPWRRIVLASGLLGAAALVTSLVAQPQGEVKRTPSTTAAAGPAPLFLSSGVVQISTTPDLMGGVCQCQALGPAAPHAITAVDSAAGRCVPNRLGAAHRNVEVGWDARGSVAWQSYAQGEYVGEARLAHVPEYRLRVDDQLAVYYLRTRQVQSRAYRLQVGDRVRVESLTAASDQQNAAATSENRDGAADTLDREVVVQPDGKITLPLNVVAMAAGRTIAGLQEDLERRYKEFYRVPAITVTPVEINTRLTDLLDAVDNRGGNLGGRQIQLVVTPAGQVQIPGLGSVYVQGLTLSEVKREIDARYHAQTPGVSVTVDLVQRAPRFLYVLGEVDQPGQFELDGPTTVMQAIALAGGWNIGANLRQVVVFRRGPDWRLLATIVDVRGALYARRPVPADEIWLADSDVVLVPKTPIQIVDEFVEQFFTRGLYAAIPLERIWGVDFNTVSAITSSN